MTRPAPPILDMFDTDIGANLDDALALARACASSEVERLVPAARRVARPANGEASLRDRSRSRSPARGRNRRVATSVAGERFAASCLERIVRHAEHDRPVAEDVERR